ncbi:DivIVA domain-containing protein [Thermaerobacter subterraneus]|uniref:DivIVA domain protein n=1 Tax=Thermaerobacter subterraneus DSM 13965 TaxID=867903 RepID=K6P4B0_9FIRM|nr:DivIVA domain-containing protein [Thermaerobacter subterraneus]EKP95885.1 DivIVA domain protein [Thermaerobacter subterraneus DSM 13965]
MALTPLDIHNKQFSRSFRGYNETQVDEFLEQVGREFDQVLRDNAALREQVEALNAKLEQYRQLEDTLHNTLVVAQETAEEVKASAQKQAELTINQARLEADQIIQAARAKAEEMERRYQELVNSIKVARARMRAMLMAHLQLLDEEPGLGGEETREAAEEGAREETEGDEGPAGAQGPAGGPGDASPHRTGARPAAGEGEGVRPAVMHRGSGSWGAAREVAAGRDRMPGF